MFQGKTKPLKGVAIKQQFGKAFLSFARGKSSCLTDRVKVNNV
jgi:hypothetical protein